MKGILVLLILCLVRCSQGLIGVQSGLGTQIPDYSCFVDQGFDFTQTCFSDQNGQIYPTSMINLINAQEAGIKCDMMIINTNDVNVLNYVQSIKQQFAPILFDRIVIQVRFLKRGPALNCAYLQDLNYYVQQAFPKKKILIYASQSDWQNKIGSQCDGKFTNTQIFYVNYDGNPNFTDWQRIKFGAWAVPYEKHYDTGRICGYPVDYLYKETW